MCALSVSHVFSPDCSFATTLSFGWTKSEATIHWDLIRYFISEVSVDGFHLSGSKVCSVFDKNGMGSVSCTEARALFRASSHMERWGSLDTHTCLTDPVIRHQLNVPSGDHVSHQDVRER